MTAPLFPAVRYEKQKYNLAPIIKDSPYVGYGPSVDRAWDSIANDGKSRFTLSTMAPFKQAALT